MSEVFPFIYVRSDALEHKELLKSPATFLVLCTISLFAKRKKDGSCYFKQNTVANHLGKSRQAISKSLKTLEQLGFIEIIPQTYNGVQSNNAYRILYDTPLNSTVQCDVAAVQHDVAHAVQHDVAPKPVSYKPNKEKEPLTRFSFCREINNAYQAGTIGEEFAHLDECEIVNAAGACCDWMELNLKYPVEGKAVYQLRTWLRKGMQSGAIRKARKASKECGEVISEQELPEWQQRALADGLFTQGEMKSWISTLEWNGNGTITAPTNFIANYVENNYMPQLRQITHSQIKMEVRAQ